MGELIRVILPDGRELPGQSATTNERLDVALVRTTAPGVRPLPLGDAGTLKVGYRIVVIGSPVGLQFSLAEGTVSNLSRTVLGVSYIQLDAKINPGNSGGPVLDGQGRVVGIVSLKVPAPTSLITSVTGSPTDRCSQNSLIPPSKRKTSSSPVRWSVTRISSPGTR